MFFFEKKNQKTFAHFSGMRAQLVSFGALQLQRMSFFSKRTFCRESNTNQPGD
jgi:hypothetical protein